MIYKIDTAHPSVRFSERDGAVGNLKTRSVVTRTATAGFRQTGDEEWRSGLQPYTKRKREPVGFEIRQIAI